MNTEENWDIVIKPKKEKYGLNLKEVWQYRDLLLMYINRNITTVYKQTVFGPLWFFIQPIFSTIMYTFVFGGIAGIPTDGIPQPLFYMAGILCWTYFTECLNSSSSTFSGNANVFSKVYFPRLVVPLSGIISNIFKLSIQFFLFFALYIYFVVAKGTPMSINIYALLFPVLIVMLAFLGFAFGIIISSMTVKYRDLTILVAFAVNLWMYATPIIYPLSILKDRFPEWAWLIEYNPLSPIIETFKFGFLGAGEFSWYSLGYSLLFTVVITLFGIRTFNKVERNFVDVV
ncbi:ABC transporter permease [Dysgonomonas sp. 520]|uniref:ABC transporter permease n=1 Tax=Dysgonomonas sp. 520 TaxID=2302931 RepID=UPI0013D235CB|nr:ABC transporter permease [Dysgonomonas sp. 520]